MKSWPLSKSISTISAVVLILTGLFISSTSLVGFLRSSTTEFLDELLLGATFFRIGLILLGILILILNRLPIWDQPESNDTEDAKKASRNGVKILVGILLISVALRLYQLNAGLWLDEILTYMNYARLQMGDIITTYDSENQHFLFTILARVSFILFGESSWALRLPAVLFGAGSIWALYLFGCEVSDERETLLATTLLAFSYHHVWFSQNARGYTGLLFWTILASWLFLRALKESRSQLWVQFAIVTALGMYTHLSMIFVVIGQFIIFLGTLYRRRHQQWPQKWFGFFLGFCIAGFLTLLVYALVLPQMSAAAEESVVAEWKNPLWTLLEFVRGIQIGFSGSLAALGGIVVLIALFVFGVGLVSYWRSNANVLFLMFIPSIIGAGLTVALGHHLWPRFFFFTFGFGALVAVRGVMVLGNWAGKLLKFYDNRSTKLGLVLCMGMILLSAASMTFAYGPKQDFESGLQYVESQKKPGDAIASASLAALIYENFYKADWAYVESEEQLNLIRSQANRTWMLYTFPPVLESVYPDVMESIQNDFQVVKMFNGSVGQGAIFVAVSNDLATHTSE